ncbi:MAG: hypothetical protein ACJ78Q_19405 [Chloroflexia bacterium]
MFRLKAQLATSLFLVLAALVLVGPSLTEAAPPSGRLYLDGQVVRTHVVNDNLPNGGIDPLYMVTNGASGQLSVVRYGPGSSNYHGGAWAVNLLTFNSGVSPYLLTSADDVDAAEAAGDVTITRVPSMDNRCPINR